MNQDKSPDNLHTCEGVAECPVNDDDTLKSVKLKAKDHAQDNVQKKIADYVYSFLKDRYLTLPEDETLSIANEISNITSVKYSFIDSDDDNLTVRATVTAQIDSKDIMNYIIRFFKERAELKSQNEALRKENEDLKRQLAKKSADEDKISLSKQKVEEGWKLWNKKDFNESKGLFDEAIEINHFNSRAYYGRGTVYLDLNQYERAIQDFDMAIQLNPKYNMAYYNRGLAYRDLNKHKKAFDDFNKCIQLAPNDYDGYRMRGICYEELGDEAKAQADFDKATALGYKG